MARQFECSSRGPVVKTKSGLLRGFLLDGTYTFHGIKYAQAKRFQPPQPVELWDGVRDATSYGHVAPLMSPNSPAMDMLIPHRFWPESEDCLYLNVWSRGINDGGKRPVMVWLHGGGYSAGSSIEMVAYDGDNLARCADAVVVTVNHRLNILGYFDLSSFDKRFANSGNAGQADIVEALRWVRDNIAAFGGDPDNVTIFGQSGGGGKVLSLLQTPEADGLFHKGIMMSGGAGRPFFTGKRRDADIADALLRRLGGDDVSVLETVPFDALVRAFDAVSPSLREQGIFPMWEPTANGWYVGSPYDVGYTEHARTVPLMVGSVISEFGFMGNVPDKDNVPAARRRELIAQRFGENADRLTELFRAAYPDKNELGLLTLAGRSGIMDFCARRAAECSAPTYEYLFCFDFPVDGGMPAWHCSDIPFAFHNTDKVAVCNDGERSDALEAAYFGAFSAFARTGDPNGPGLPRWPVCTEGTMFFDAVSRAEPHPDAELHRLFDSLVPNPFAALFEKKDDKKITF